MIFTTEEIERSAVVFAADARSIARADGLYVFGAGRAGAWLRDVLAGSGVTVDGIVDNNAELWGNGLDGMCVVSPAELRRVRPGALVAVCVLGEAMADVLRQCRDLGLNAHPFHRIMAMYGVDCFADPMTAGEIEADAGAVGALTLWADTASREKYVRLLRLHALRDGVQELPAEPDQYFNPVYMPRRRLRAMADAGAYDGDTLRRFLEVTGGDFDAYYGFEPDGEFFAALRQSVPAAAASRARLYHTALGAREGVARMARLAPAMTSFAAAGDIAVPVGTLDGMLTGRPVSLIKMDVEGAEPDVLAGAEKLIRAQRPALAISIYHRVAHLWAIPSWIAGLDLGYSFSLGFHGRIYSEAICYAVPRGGGAPEQRSAAP